MFVSTRERIRELLAHGLSVAEVARRTGLAYTTVSYHCDRLQHGERSGQRVTPDRQPPENFLLPVRTREEVHRLLSGGHSRAEVARRLGISKSTVTYHAGRHGL